MAEQSESERPSMDDDVISAIMSHWGGHRIGLTCRRWLRELAADNYAKVGIWHERDDSPIVRVMVSYLPNGLFHGQSTCTRLDPMCYGDESVEIISCDRGIVSRVDLTDGKNVYIVRRDIVVNGCVFIWTRDLVYRGLGGGTGSMHATDIPDIVFHRGTVTLDEFESVARELTQSHPGHVGAGAGPAITTYWTGIINWTRKMGDPATVYPSAMGRIVPAPFMGKNVLA